MKLILPKALLLRAADALERVAKDIQGHSQVPDLVRKEETQEWQDADTLRQAAKGKWNVK